MIVQNAPTLPDIDDRPGADVVIFDGDCRFCQGQVANLHRWDRHQRLSFISLHDPRVQEKFPDLTYDQMMEQMYVIPDSGERLGGIRALKHLTTRLPRLYALRPLFWLPFSLTVGGWIYQQIAKRRYRIAGKNCDGGTCSIHAR